MDTSLVDEPQDLRPDLIVRDLLGPGGREILNMMGIPVFMCEQHTVVFANSSACRVFCTVAAENVIGRPIDDLVDEKFADVIALGLRNFAEEPEGVPLKMMTMNGTAIDVKMIVHLLEDSDSPVFLLECQDVTAFIRASGEARLKQERLNSILRSVQESIVSIDEYGTIIGFNPAAEKLFGHSQQAAIGQNVSVLMPAPHAAKHHEYVLNYLVTGERRFMGGLREVEAVRADGSVFPLEINVTETHDSSGRRSFTAVMRDITLRKRQEEELRFIAYHDPLTRLPNRSLFEERLTRALSRSTRAEAQVALMFIDLDKFKPINDTLGHEAGDIVLVNVAQRLRKLIRDSDTAARIGGDEFVIVLDEMRDVKGVERVAQGVLESLAEPIEAGGTECRIGASIGIALFPQDADDLDGLTKAADEAMYKVKEAGRNAYRFYRRG